MEERILSACSRDEMTGCLRFNRRLDKDGYGQISHNSKTRHTHKVMWESKNGPVPEGLCLIHLCDEKYPKDSKEYRSCCEVSHLKVGTNKENLERMSDLGRWRPTTATFKKGECSGEDNAHCKHSDAKLLELDAEIKKGYVYGELKKLAEKFGVSYQIAQKIAYGTYNRVNKLLASP